MTEEALICTYPHCEREAVYKIVREKGVAYLCKRHYHEVRAVGLGGKSYRLSVKKETTP